MKSFYIKPPEFIQILFQDIIWKNNRDEIILTFDDGPFPDCTDLILDFLRHHNLKALFFVNGNLAAKEKGSIEKIISYGSYLGNHSFNHLKEWLRLSHNDIKEEIINTEKALIDLNNFLKIFRPPYGKINKKMIKVCKELNYKIMIWSLLTEDYSGSLEKVKNNISKYLRSNSIVVFHNNPKSKKIIIPSLEFLLEESLKRGYKIGTAFGF